MTTPSSISITYDGVDITSDCMFEACSFEQNAGAVAGQFQLKVKDLNRTHDFIPGQEVIFTLDGQRLFGGICTSVKREFAFNVVDTSVISNVQERVWELTGPDFNIWLDKLVLHNPDDYKKAIEVSSDWDGNLIRNTLKRYFDTPAGFDTSTHVHNILQLGNSKTGTWAYPTQGGTMRQVLESMRVWSGATYWIDADKKLHWEPVGTIDNPWGLTDKPELYPATAMVPCREVNATQDGAGMVTDALVWSGNKIYANSESYVEDGSGLFFARFPNPPANTEKREGKVIWNADQEQRGINKQNKWGRWQMGEQNFGSGNSPYLGGIRARTIVLGPGGVAHGVDGGLGQPLWDVSATWFAHDVPGQTHAVAGYLMNLIFWGLGTNNNPLVQYLPCRHVSVTFPTIPESPSGNETYVKFQGKFGTSYSDHRKLWSQLKSGKRKISAYATSTAVASRFSQIEASDPTASPTTGSFGQLPAEMDPVIQDMTKYETGHAYIPGTLRVYLNGLYQRPGIEYFESTPGEGEIEFYTPLLPTDEVFIEFRAAGDTVG